MSWLKVESIPSVEYSYSLIAMEPFLTLHSIAALDAKDFSNSKGLFLINWYFYTLYHEFIIFPS